MKRVNRSKIPFYQRLLELISEPDFIKYFNMLREPNIFQIVGRTHYERWHSCFFGWLLDTNGSHLLYDYVLTRILLLLHDERCLKARNHDSLLITKLLPNIEFKEVDVTPNEFISSEVSVKNLGRFNIFLSSLYCNHLGISNRLNVIFELKIDSKIDGKQAKKYANWLQLKHPNDTNILIYILPKVLSSSNSKSTIGDDRWYCMDYQLLNDKLLLPILENPNLNEKVKPFIIQYIKNLKIRYKGIKMAITNEEKKLAIELYEKYNDVLDAIFDALQEANIIEYSTSEIPSKGRKKGKIAVLIDNKIFEGNIVRTLFKNILKYIVDKEYIERIPLPWGVGNTRYIVTNEAEPKHPNGRDFFYPVSYKEYTI